MSHSLKKLNAYIRENEVLGTTIQEYLDELFRAYSMQIMQAEDGEVTTRLKGRLTMLADLANSLTGTDPSVISQSEVKET